MPETGLRWFITQYHHGVLPPFFRVYLQTDVECHLTLYYTHVTPQKRLEGYQLRGARALLEPRWCFVEYTAVEQEEDGDTIQHTFLMPDWDICTKRWWGIAGTLGGLPSPSCSPIIMHHRTALETLHEQWYLARRPDSGYLWRREDGLWRTYYPSAYMEAGKYADGLDRVSWYRGYSRFDISNIPKFATILDARFYAFLEFKLERGMGMIHCAAQAIRTTATYHWPQSDLELDDWNTAAYTISSGFVLHWQPEGRWYDTNALFAVMETDLTIRDRAAVRLRGSAEDTWPDWYTRYRFVGSHWLSVGDRPDGTHGILYPMLYVKWETPAG